MFNAALSVGLSCASVFKLAAKKFIGKLLETFHLVIVICDIFYHVHYLTNYLWLSLIVRVTACITNSVNEVRKYNITVYISR